MKRHCALHEAVKFTTTYQSSFLCLWHQKITRDSEKKKKAKKKKKTSALIPNI
jgi:hypothetical protein